MTSILSHLRDDVTSSRGHPPGVQATAGLRVPLGPVGAHRLPDAGHWRVPPLHPVLGSPRGDPEPAHPRRGALDQPPPGALHGGEPGGAGCPPQGALMCNIYGCFTYCFLSSLSGMASSKLCPDLRPKRTLNNLLISKISCYSIRRVHFTCIILFSILSIFILRLFLSLSNLWHKNFLWD